MENKFCNNQVWRGQTEKSKILSSNQQDLRFYTLVWYVTKQLISHWTKQSTFRHHLTVLMAKRRFCSADVSVCDVYQHTWSILARWFSCSVSIIAFGFAVRNYCLFWFFSQLIFQETGKHTRFSVTHSQKLWKVVCSAFAFKTQLHSLKRLMWLKYSRI